jgi:hypothetical protein
MAVVGELLESRRLEGEAKEAFGYRVAGGFAVDGDAHLGVGGG